VNQFWEHNINNFIKLSDELGVKMLMVGGGAVNYHGYKRHSADVDFWIETSEENLEKLILVFNKMGYEIDSFPNEVIEKKQNISVNFSPTDIDLELITRFSVNKTFDEAYKDSILVKIEGVKFLKWNVLNYEDLLTSKIKAGRPKDLLDIQELRRIKKD